LRRAVPGVGYLLLAYDLYQLGCQAGILGSTICPSPTKPAPGIIEPSFKGGQCSPANYAFRLGNNNRFMNANGVTGTTLPGKIVSITPVSTYQITYPFPPFNQCRYTYQICNSAGECKLYDDVLDEICASYPTVTPVRVNSFGDPIADTCGDPAGKPSDRTAPPNVTDVTKNPPYIVTPPNLLPPKPAPNRPPIIVVLPNPAPDEFDNPFPDINPRRLPIVSDPFSISPTPIPNLPSQPNQDPPPTLVPAPNPPQPAPVPPVVVPNFEDCDPCAIYTMRLCYEILEKLYKANAEILNVQETLGKHGLVLDNLQKQIDVELEGAEVLSSCDDIEIVYSYKGKSLTGLNQHVNQLEKQHQQIIRDICAIEAETQVAVPDWWQVRLGADVPQICVVFRRVGHLNYYSLSIPHPINTTIPTVSPLPAYTKGNWQGQIILKDNSKFTCNCVSPVEAERICNVALTLIDPLFLESPPRVHISERKGQGVKVDSMLPRAVMYFPEGQKQTVPAWRKAFNLNDPIGQFS
jgi:hypothetical protein